MPNRISAKSRRRLIFGSENSITIITEALAHPEAMQENNHHQPHVQQRDSNRPKG